MIKAIIFDCFGVLTTDTWKEFVATLDDALIDEARNLNRAYDAGALTKPEFLTAIKDLTGDEPKYVDEMLDHETDKNTQLLDYIRDLKSNYKTGILSNVGTPWITEHFLTPDECKLFDATVFSYQVGMTKPDPRIFELACERLEVEPAEAVMVDDIDSYCAAARGIGMQAVVYENITQFKADLTAVLSHD